MKKKLTIAVLFLLTAVLLAGCKSDVKREESSDSSKALDDAVIDSILEKGYITVGCNDEQTKLFQYDEKTNKYSGLEADIAFETAAEIFGVTSKQAEKDGLVKFVPVDSEDRENKLLWGEYDVLLANFTITGERKKLMSFSDTYCTDYLAFLVSEKSDIDDVKSLSDKNVAVVRSSTSEEHLKTYFSSCDKTARYPFFFEYSDLDSAVSALKNGDVSAVCCDDNLISEYVSDGYKLLDETIVGQHYGAAVKPKNELLLEYLNKAIEKCIK